jgi:hypothetical protein
MYDDQYSDPWGSDAPPWWEQEQPSWYDPNPEDAAPPETPAFTPFVINGEAVYPNTNIPPEETAEKKDPPVDKVPGGGGSANAYANAYAGGGGGGGAYNFPMFTAPRYQRATPFSYADFTAPDPNQLANDPSYQFRLKEGQRALENSAGARGTLRTGGTLKDLLGYGQSFASQEYNNIYNRAADTYDRNRNNAFTSWSANTDENRAAYDRDFQASWNEFLPKQRAAELQFGRDWDLFTYMNDDAFRRWATQGNWASNVMAGGNS